MYLHPIFEKVLCLEIMAFMFGDWCEKQPEINLTC
jgi:hypothetical protein